MTIKEAAQKFVNEMDFIPQSMIAKLMTYEPDDWMEVTTPAPGDRVYVYDIPEGSDDNEGEITAYNEEDDTYTVEMDDGAIVELSADDFEVQYDDGLPMWGTMFSFKDPCDIHWIEDGDGIGVLSRCGFRVYYSEEFGYFFGVDGCGYDFYDAHWIPLYKVRGLQWHDTEEESR